MNNIIKENEFIMICTARKKYMGHVVKDKTFCTKAGILSFNEIIGQEYGCRVKGHSIYKPNLDDIVLYGLNRQTQVIYSKEASQIITKLNLQNKFKVFECGTGSGAMSLFIARAIAPEGTLYTYEKEKQFHLNARNNIENFGSPSNIKMFHHNIDEGIDEKDFDAAFIDLKEPYDYVDFILSILKKGACVGIIVPTANQVMHCIRKLEGRFYDIEVMEILMRNYKPNPDRLRPNDIMIGHTGYLVFAR